MVEVPSETESSDYETASESEESMGGSTDISSEPPTPSAPRTVGMRNDSGSTSRRGLNRLTGSSPSVISHPEGRSNSRPTESLYAQTPQRSSHIHTDTDTSDDEDGGDVPRRQRAPGQARPLGRSRTAPTAIYRDGRTVDSPTSQSSTTARITSTMTRLTLHPASPRRAGPSSSTSPPSSAPALNTRSRSLLVPSPESTVVGSETDAPEYVIIAHDQHVQAQMDQYGLPWSVQYEFARGVSDGRWKWEDIPTQEFARLAGASPRRHVEQIMGKPSSYGGKLDIWEELDREQDAIEEGEDRGLGLEPGDWHGETKWYGGRVQQMVYLREVPGGFHPELGPMQKVGRSHRIARFLGSRRLLQVRLPDKAMHQDRQVKVLHQLLSRKFILCGRIFVPFAIKDGKAHLVETNEDYQRMPRIDQGDGRRMAFVDFIGWYNPLELNQHQNLSKYAARIDLGLSTSIPVLEFKPENFHWIRDDCAAHQTNKVPTEKIFTDGCGYMNVAALLAIGRAMCYTTPPTAVQGRILGSKGVWVLHPTDRDPLAEPRIWIRPSQIKVHLVNGDNFTKDTISRIHRAHRIFDLLMPSKVTAPSRLSRLTIMNLEHNGVKANVFTTLLRDGLRKEIEALTLWNGPSAMPLLWNAVNKAEGVAMQRLQRSAAGLQRVLGLSRKRDEQYSDDEFEVLDLPASSQSSFGSVESVEPDPVGETDVPPPSLAEEILDLIQAGFSPKEDRHLYDRLKDLITYRMNSYIKEYHITVPQSLEAFIVPDPFGVLEEGEIHFRSSQDIIEGCLYLDPKAVIGDVLIYRNPARVPSDVQKVRAVQRPELTSYVDVIVLPTKGRRSLANLLAGGDVDGDTAVVIFDPAIVDKFRPPPITAEPLNLEDNFESQDTIPKVSEVVGEMNAYPDDQNEILQKYLLVGLSDFDKKGMYSRFHEYAIYTLGYNHEDTILMAYMFTTVLDSRKSGMVVKPEAYRQHKREFDQPMPECLGGDGPSRKVNGQLFILEALLRAGRVIQRDLLRKYEELKPEGKWKDEDLLRPWKKVTNLSTRIPEIAHAVAALEAFVVECGRDWAPVFDGLDRQSSQNGAKKTEKKARERSIRRKKHELALRFATQAPTECEVLRDLGILDKVKASYAYELKPKFARAVAWQALCQIKAESKGLKAFTMEIGSAMTIPSAEVRTRTLLSAAFTSTVPTP